MREVLDIVDLSVSGLSLSSPALRATELGQRLKLQITLGVRDDYPVDAVTRWKSGDGVGVELVEPSQSTTQALGKYIAELLERGGSA